MPNDKPNIRIILINAYRDFESGQKALHYKNVVDYITMPLKYELVISALMGLLRTDMSSGKLDKTAKGR